MKTVNRRRWSGTLNYLDRIIVFASTIGAALIALLLEHFLGLGIGEAKKQLHTIFGSRVVILRQDFLGDFAGFESSRG